MREVEKFVSDAEMRSSMGSTFIILTYIFGGMLLAGVLIWSYTKSDVLFISILSGIISVYSIAIVVFIASIRSKLTSLQFKLLMTTSIFMMILCMSSTVMYIVRATSSESAAVPMRRRPVEDRQFSYDDEE